MARVDDVAAYILSQLGPMSAMKLQKLVYYSQAWHLVWDEVPLYDDRIEAWANGPVVYSLYRQHRGQFTINDWPSGNPSGLDPSERETVDIVLQNYGDLSGRTLSRLTHDEWPWREARQGLGATDRSNEAIDLDTMADFYAGLEFDDDAVPVTSLDRD